MRQEKKEYIAHLFITILISLYLSGCSRAVIEQHPVEQSSREVTEQSSREQIKQPVKQPSDLSYKNRSYKNSYKNKREAEPQDQIQFKRPVDYFGRVPSYPLHRISEAHYPDFTRDIHGKEGLKRALKQSITYYGKVGKSKKFYFGGDIYNADHMRLSAQKFLDFLEKSPSPQSIRNFLHKHYNIYTTVRRADSPSRVRSYSTSERESAQIDLSVMFTGYYEPSMKGSLVKGGEYIYPIYSKPDDLIEVPRGGFTGKYRGTPASGARRNQKNELVPYYTRAEIDAMKGFENHARPLAWVRSRIDRFFLEIQGSGIIELKQGGQLKVQYHSKNGRPYRSIGKYLIDKGEMAKEDVTMQSIRKWLDNNPSRVDEVLNHNPSFVFFKKGEGGPVGCLGVEVTPMRSIATDSSIFPKGALGFMDTTVPTWSSREDNIAWQNYAVFVLNQDTGGAIKGSGRADYFCGHGRYAELAAGYMKQAGRLYFLVLKSES